MTSDRADTPTVDDLLTRADQRVSEDCEGDGWLHPCACGELIADLAAALRAQTAENEQLSDAQPAWREMVQAQQAEMDALGRRLTEVRAELAEARAAAPQPLHRAKTRSDERPASDEYSRLTCYLGVPPGTEVAVYRVVTDNQEVADG